MTTPIPASGYPSNSSRTQGDMQTYFETMLSIAKEQLGGTGEAASVQLSGNAFTPGNNNCVFVIDTNGLGPNDTLNTITPSNMRDGEVIFLRITNNGRVITVTNNAGGTGQIYTIDGNNIVLSDTRTFLALKYNVGLLAFEQLFISSPGVNWGSPGEIGIVTPNDATFTTITLTGQVSGGVLFGNALPSLQAPNYIGPGTANQVLGVSPMGGLEYKTIQGGVGVTVTPTTGFITISAPMDLEFPGIVQGFTTFTSSGLTATLNTSPNSSGGTAALFVNGNNVTIPFGDGRLAIFVTTNSDTYIDVNSSGTFTATAVANNAAAPATIANTLRLCKIVSNASSITAVVYLAPTVQKQLPIVEWKSAGAYSDPTQSDGVICAIGSLSTLSSLTTTMVPAGVGVLIVQGGQPNWIPVGDSRLTNTYTASKDTYVDFGGGSFVYTAVSNNATPPSLTAGNVRVGLVVSGASTITASYWFGGSVSLLPQLGGGGNIATANTVPTSGTWTGEYWQYGSLSTHQTKHTQHRRIHVVGDVVVNNAITVNTEMPGASGTQWSSTFSMNGSVGGGLSPGATGINTAGGGGGGNGGAGGAGGSATASATAPGGPAIPFILLSGSGGGAGGNSTTNPAALNAGGAGGGGLYIEASGNIYVLANISANGAAGTSTSTTSAAGGGGGSGGCVELRAGGQVYVASGVTIAANGGSGGNSTATTKGGGGGGGGGGFIRLKGVRINNQGTLSVAGGSAGTGSTTVAAAAGGTGVTDVTAVCWGPRSPS